MSLNSFKTECRKRLLDFLWKQWGLLGIATTAISEPDDRILDPEALLVVSATIARGDPRLFDEIIDWTIENSSFLNFPRLKSILEKKGFRCRNVMAAVAEVVGVHNKRLNWKLTSDTSAPEPLFFSVENGEAIASFGQLDPVFEQHGYLRGRYERRRLARRFDPTVSASALLRLRSLLGISARAEILVYLMTHDVAHPSQISRDTGYSQKNVQDSLVDMTASALVAAYPIDGRRIGYSLVDREGTTRHLLGLDGTVHWINWIPLCRMLAELWDGLDTLAEQSSTLVLATMVRELKDRLESYCVDAGLIQAFSPSETYQGEAAPLRLESDVDRLLTRFGV